jgi:uncharacterized protein (TIGR02145 family)
MKETKFIRFFCLLTIAFISIQAYGQKPKVGAYYFHGWSGLTDQWHLPSRLKNDYPEREPSWGWYTNTVSTMEQQIDFAADNGLNFFTFCWYQSASQEKWIVDALNQGLDLYLKSTNRNRLEFSIFVSNHDESFTMGPNEWEFCTNRWVQLFQESGYQKVDDRPVIIFNRYDLLLAKWGSYTAITQAFKVLDDKARAAGLKEPLIGIHTLPGWNNLRSLKSAGFDFFTGYNYGNDIAAASSNLEQPWSQLRKTGNDIWQIFALKNVLPYVPVVTTGWDMRPWETGDPKAYYYTPRTPENIAGFLTDAIGWTKGNPTKTFSEPFIVLYAWNENGEGGYLTPTKSEGDVVLRKIKEVLVGDPTLNGDTMYIYKAGIVIKKRALSDIDSITFYKATIPEEKIVLDIDDNIYHTIKIGTQEWLMENLKTTKYNDGETIPLVTNTANWSALTTPAFCWYNNDESVILTPVGALYNMHTILKGKLCPIGWHVPSFDEWETLNNYLGGSDVSGGKLKTASGSSLWYQKWSGANTGASNSAGFWGIPAGVRVTDGAFVDMSWSTRFWTSSEENSDVTKGKFKMLHSNTASLWQGSESKTAGYSVRCIKD